MDLDEHYGNVMKSPCVNGYVFLCRFEPVFLQISSDPLVASSVPLLFFPAEGRISVGFHADSGTVPVSHVYNSIVYIHPCVSTGDYFSNRLPVARAVCHSAQPGTSRSGEVLGTKKIGKEHK